MNLSEKKNIAKLIKTFFILVFIAGGINLVIYIVLSAVLKPPVNPPVPESVKQNIRNQSSLGRTIYFGDAFKTYHKYDKNISLYDIEYDRINENRDRNYKKDLRKQFGVIFYLTFVVVVLGFYLIRGARWVLIYSSDKPSGTSLK